MVAQNSRMLPIPQFDQVDAVLREKRNNYTEVALASVFGWIYETVNDLSINILLKVSSVLTRGWYVIWKHLLVISIFLVYQWMTLQVVDWLVLAYGGCNYKLCATHVKVILDFEDFCFLMHVVCRRDKS